MANQSSNKVPTAASMSRELSAAVTWWSERLFHGQQLQDLDDFMRGFDYRGPGPWFTHVAYEALGADFRARSGLNTSHFKFTHLFRKVFVRPVRTVYMTVGLDTGSGVKFRPQRSFVIFPSSPLDCVPPTDLH